MLCAMAGCSSRDGDNAPDASTTPGNVTLTAAQRSRITLHTVAPSNFHPSIDTTGVVDFDQDRATQVLAPFSGPVASLLVAQGDHVQRGQALATVTSPDFAAALGAYRKAVATADNTRRIADFDADMLQHHAIAQREAEQAQADATGAEADRVAALQALAALDIDPHALAQLRAGKDVAHVEGVIRAPIAGTVVEKNITPGQLLQAGSTPCFTIADTSRVWVNANVFGDDVASVHAGDAAQVFAGEGGRPLAGKVTNVSAEVDPDTRAVVARVALANPDDALKKAMYVRVRIESRQARNGLLVPVSAVLRDDDNLPFVYVVQADGSYARAHVALGQRIGDDDLIPSGLRAGERIVTEGALFLRFIQTQ
ncbi:MAG: efflux RND transporter periplasmic adaptor subunit [Proteobacteria bacterium]|nr:efflux RND transporter periplasmic adaptor subunit [Pseudomonadota bacterium]